MGVTVSEMKSNPQQYPRWITLEDGNKVIVQNHQHHSAMTGQEYDENAELVVKRKKHSAPEPEETQPEPAPTVEPDVAPEPEPEEDLTQMFTGKKGKKKA